jgi:hypothetical protein
MKNTKWVGGEANHPCDGCNTVIVPSIIPFPSVFAFKETSGQPEISQRQRGENKVTKYVYAQRQSSMTLEYKNSHPG